MPFHADSSAPLRRGGELRGEDHRVWSPVGRWRSRLILIPPGCTRTMSTRHASLASSRAHEAGVRDGATGPEMGLEGLCAFS